MGKRIDSQKLRRREQRRNENGGWRTLLACAAEIASMDPWERLGSGDLIAYIPQSGDRMIFFSCVLDMDDSFGIMVFPSPADYRRTNGQSASARQETRDYIEMTAYSVNFTRKEDVPPENLQLYKRLSVDFGDGMWPWAACKPCGYTGRMPRGEEVFDLLDCLGNFHMALKALETGLRQPDFANGEMLLRYYSPERKLWQNVIAPFDLPPFERSPLEMRADSPKLKALRALPTAQEVRRVELDFGWLPELHQENARDEPFYPLVVALADRETGRELSCHTCRPEEMMDCILTAWAVALRENGIPQTLYVSRDETAALLADFAQKLGVKLKRVKRLPAAGRALRDAGAV